MDHFNEPPPSFAQPWLRGSEGFDDLPPGRMLQKLLCEHDTSLFERASTLSSRLQRHFPLSSLGAIESRLSQVFSDRKRLTEEWEMALRTVVRERLKPHAFADTARFRKSFEACLHELRAGRGKTPLPPRETLIEDLKWADVVTIVSSRGDPAIREWRSHPLDGFLAQTIVEKMRTYPANESRPAIVLSTPSVGDTVVWLGRMVATALFAFHRYDVSYDPSAWDTRPLAWDVSDETYKRVSADVRQALRWLRRLDGEKILLLKILPAEACWMPTVITEVAGKRRSYCHWDLEGKLHLSGVPSEATKVLNDRRLGEDGREKTDIVLMSIEDNVEAQCLATMWKYARKDAFRKKCGLPPYEGELPEYEKSGDW